MPRITTFDAPDNLGLRPTETGINAVAAAARRVQGEYNEAAAARMDTGRRIGQDIALGGEIATKFIEHREVSAGAATFAEMQDGLQKRWDATAKQSDPNDPTIAAKFQQEVVEPTLQKFRDGFLTESGQKFAENSVDRLRQHLYSRTSADMSTLAGIAVHNNTLKTINTLTGTVYNDPSSLDFARGTLKESVDGLADSSPNLSAAQNAKLKAELMEKGQQQIVRAAVEGAISKGADWRKIADDPKNAEYIDRAELESFVKKEQYYSRLDQSEQRAARQQADYEAKKDFNAKANELRLQTMPQDIGARPTLPQDYWQQVRKLGQHPGAALEPSLLKQLVNEGDAITNRMNKPEPIGAVSRRTMAGLFQRFRATDDSRLDGDEAVKAVYDEYDAGRLSTSDFRVALSEVRGLSAEGRALRQDRNEFFRKFMPQIDPTLGVGGLEGEKMYQAEMDARRLEDALRKKGLDPHLVYQPGSEYFFGRPENLTKYRPTLQEKQEYDARQKAERNKQGAPPKPREFSPADQQAIDWANANPRDPRAAIIKRRLGVQ